MTSTRRKRVLGGLGLLTLLVSGAAQAASSRDYPGPCPGETTLPGTPVYLSSDARHTSVDARIINMPDVGRFRLGISCVATGFVIIRIGPDSAVCQNLGKCTPEQLSTLTPQEVDWVQRAFPAQVALNHICQKHGFGWYDGLSVPPGPYLVSAKSISAGFVNGHGTMDTYVYTGNGGAFQPVNCSH